MIKEFICFSFVSNIYWFKTSANYLMALIEMNLANTYKLFVCKIYKNTI